MAAGDREWSSSTAAEPPSTPRSTTNPPTNPAREPAVLADMIRELLPARTTKGGPYGDAVLASVVESYARRR